MTTIDVEYVKAITDKKDLIEYASNMGIEGLVKQRSLKKLKDDLISMAKPKFDFSKLKGEIEEADNISGATIDGSPKYTVYKNGVEVESIELTFLDEWCSHHKLNHHAIKSTLNRPHVNHNGYHIMGG